MLRTVIFHLGGIPPWQAAIQAPEIEKAGRESSRSCSLQQAQFVPGQLPVPVGCRASAQGCAVVGAAAAGPGSRPPAPAVVCGGLLPWSQELGRTVQGRAPVKYQSNPTAFRSQVPSLLAAES